MKARLAIFVKTPGLSPVKTRLAATLGRERAEDFYRLSCQAVLASAKEAEQRLGPDLEAVWAVAEPAGLALWSGLPTISQGAGDLGERLAAVYAEALTSADAVILLGADSPMVSADDICAAWHALHEAELVMGLAEDGGFWCFAGRRALPRELWVSVPYSQTDTAARLTQALAPWGKPRLLREHRDVDCEDDLPALAYALSQTRALSDAQLELAEWLSVHGIKALTSTQRNLVGS